MLGSYLKHRERILKCFPAWTLECCLRYEQKLMTINMWMPFSLCEYLMCFLNLRSYKQILTMSTTVRFFSGVNSCMSLQFVWRSKNHATMSTQINGFSPIWTFECRLKADGPLTDFLHNVQMNGFSPVWTLICVFWWLEAENDFLQWGQLKGLSHVWTLVCFFCPAKHLKNLLN
jgi:hypothetical protein